MTLRMIPRTEHIRPNDLYLVTDWAGGDTATIDGELYITHWHADYWLGPFSKEDASMILELIAEADCDCSVDYGDC